MRKVQSREDFLIEAKTYLPLDANAVEIGVLYGDFSSDILRIIDPVQLVLVDPYTISEKRYTDDINSLPTAYSTEADYEKVVKRFNVELITGKVRIVKKYSHDAVKDFPDNIFNMGYIDASHLYEDVSRDLDDWFPKIKKGGLLCGHDFVDAHGFGVMQAVTEFKKAHGLEMVIFNENGGDFALLK